MSQRSEDKILVSNKSALRSKYGKKGLAAISKAVASLIAADEKRGVTTRLVFLDLVADTKPFDVPRVTEADDPQQAKAAIDAVFTAFDPDYLVILGAPDVVPHQPLTNPLADDDFDVPSDLPYACDVAFSANPENFSSPSRVVSRLPGVLGSRDAGYLVGLLETAANWKRRQRRSYESHFAVSAEVWKGSTRLTVRKLFGTTSRLELSPSGGPSWTKAKLQRRLHFLNLHGALEDDNFYGESPGRFPSAHQAEHLVGRVREGTVAVAECCYGAELYDPTEFDLHIGVANTYLGEGGYGFFGSTNIAYGPVDGNGSADLICQFFVRELLKGASLGRAALAARQTYVAQEGPLDPTDLKTLAQFCLLGDASIHPVKLPAQSKSSPKAKSFGRRRARRRKMSSKAKRLAATTASVGCKPKRGVAAKLRKVLNGLMKKHTLDFDERIHRFVVEIPQQAPSASKSLTARMAKVAAAKGSSYYLMYGQKPAQTKGDVAGGRRRGAEAVRKRRPILLALEKDGEIAAVKTLVPR